MEQQVQCMSGRLKGVAAQIQKEEPRDCIHCAAHSLHLCLQECGRSCPCIRDPLGVATELTSLIRAPPKRLAQFQNLKDDLCPGSPGLEPICPTRWTVRCSSLDAVLKNYNVLCEELTQIGFDSCGESSTKALGLLALLEKFSTYFGLCLRVHHPRGYKALSTEHAPLQYRACC